MCLPSPSRSHSPAAPISLGREAWALHHPAPAPLLSRHAHQAYQTHAPLRVFATLLPPEMLFSQPATQSVGGLASPPWFFPQLPPVSVRPSLATVYLNLSSRRIHPHRYTHTVTLKVLLPQPAPRAVPDLCIPAPLTVPRFLQGFIASTECSCLILPASSAGQGGHPDVSLRVLRGPGLTGEPHL